MLKCATMPRFDSAIVTLVDADVGYRPDGELWGGVVVKRKDGPTKLYAQFLPQYPHIDPPGWSAIAEVTGVTSEAVVQGWDDAGRENSTAERAFMLLREEAGRDFLAREVDGVSGEKAVELVPIRVDDPSVQLDLEEGQVLEGSTPTQFTPLVQIVEQIDPNDLEPPKLLITTRDALDYAIEIPDVDHNPDPPDWFFVETLTGIPASRLASSWTTPGVAKANKHLDRVKAQLGKVLMGKQAPLTKDGTELDLPAFRRALIRERFARKILPIVFTGRNPRIIAEQTWALLKDVLGNHVFRYNVERGASSGLPAMIRAVEGQAKLEVLNNREKMRGILMHHIDMCGASKKSIRHVSPPNVITDHMLTFADQSVPAIDTLVRIPTVRRDGSIHDQEGYDPKSHVWYAPELQLEAVPDVPTEQDVRNALATILAPFKEFPLIAESGSTSAALACLLDQLVRPMILGPRPLFAFDAPAVKGQGTGKTLLATAIGAIITGRDIEVTGWPDDPKELPKLITAKLMAGEPFVVFDNLEGTVRHKDLAACATSTQWSSRLLHTNEAPKFPQTATWCMTLNGARFSRDIARRTLTVRLDARVEDPYKRKGFEIKNLVPWCIKHRAAIIRACLVLVRSWVAAGRPEDDRLDAGSFEAWQSVVGGILLHAGMKDLPLALEESRSRDIDASEYEELVLRWREHFLDNQVTALQIANLAEMYSLFGSVLEKVKAPNWKGRHMAEILRKLNGHSIAGCIVLKIDGRRDGQFLFKLQLPPSDESERRALPMPGADEL